MAGVTLEAIQEARELLRGVVLSTPLTIFEAAEESTGCEVYLKLENLQRTGSFKVRGAYNKIARLSPEARRSGVVAASAGNHALGVAFAARKFGIPASIVMPESAPLTKYKAVRDMGAEVELVGKNYDEASLHACSLQERTGQTLIHAFDDDAVMAGQGTVGLELLEGGRAFDLILVPVGGGGLIAGLACAVKNLAPHTKVIGVQASGAAAAAESFRRGTLCEHPSVHTVADGIAVRRPGELTFELMRRYVDDMVVVSDEEISGAILSLIEKEKVVAEGAGAASLAALLYGEARVPAGSRVCAVISGGNIDVNIISRIIERGMARDGRLLCMDVVLEDVPGSLASLTLLLAEARANILQVSHERGAGDIAISKARVELKVETRGRDHACEILELLRRCGYVCSVR